MQSVSYSPRPLSKQELKNSLDYYQDPAMRALWETGTSYLDTHNLTAEAVQLLRPKQALETWATRGAKFIYLTHLRDIGQILGFANPISQVVGASGVGAALLLGEKLKHKLEEWEWYFESWKNTPDQALRYPLLLGQQYFRQAGTATLGTLLSPIGYGLNLIDSQPIVDFRFTYQDTPAVYQFKRVNKLTNKWRGFWADSFQGIAESAFNSNRHHLAYGFGLTARRIKEGKHKTNPISLIFVSLLGSALGTALLSFFEKSVLGSKIAATLMGAVAPAVKGIVSAPTAITAYYGYQFLNLIDRIYKTKTNFPIPIPFTPFSVPFGAVAGALPGIYYQTLINWTKNTEIIRRNIFLSDAELRRELMPKWMDVNRPQHINQYLERYARSIPGSSYLTEDTSLTRQLTFKGTDELVAIRANYFPEKGLLGRLIGKPAQFLFKHPLGRMVRLPFRGLLINTLLGLPMGLGPGTILGNVILASDYFIQVIDQIPTLKHISKGALWGAAIGAEAAYLAGLPLETGAVIGGTAGILTNSLTLLSDIRSPYRGLQTPGPYGAVFDYRIEGGSFPLWETNRPINVLRQQLPFLNKPLFNKFLTFLEHRPDLLHGLRGLRFTKGAGLGAILGVQLSLLFGWPLQITIPLAATAGVASQILWEKFLAEKFARASFGLGRALQFMGRYVVAPVTGFLSGLDIGSALSDMVRSGITTQNAVKLGLGLVGAVSTILIFGVSNPIGWIIVGTALALELGFQIFAGFSFFEWIWGKIAPFFQGVASAIGQATSYLIGGIIALVGAIFARSPEEMLQFAVIAGISFSAIGTIFITALAASGFLSGIPLQVRRAATGSLYFKTDKEVVALITNNQQQITGIRYRFSYAYLKPYQDINNQPINDPLIQVKLTDTFLTPAQLSPNDIIPPPTLNYQKQIIIDNLPDLTPGKSNSIEIEIHLAQPLDQLLSNTQSQALCNQLSLTGVLSGGIPNPTSSSSPFCLNAQGRPITPPTEMIAINLADFLNQCYVQTCGVQKDYVTAQDFVSAQDQTCPDLKEISTCNQIYQPIFNISSQALYQIQLSAVNNGWLDSLGFIQAVASQQGHTFNYSPDCTNNYPSMATNQAAPGDIIVDQTGNFGIITATNQVGANLSLTYISVNSTNLKGYVYTNGFSYTEDVRQVLRYNPNYFCP